MPWFNWILMMAAILMTGIVSSGCSEKRSSGSPVLNGQGNQPTGNNGGQNQPSGTNQPSDADLIKTTPAFSGQQVVVVTRRLDTAGGNAVGPGVVAYSDPRPDPNDPNQMLVDVVVNAAFDDNHNALSEVWVKMNAPVVGNFDAVQLMPSGGNGWRGTIKVPVAQGMHITLYKTNPVTAAGSSNPAHYFTGLPFDSSYQDPPKELRLWVAIGSDGNWHTYVPPYAGASAPPQPASTLPQPPSTLSITSANASPSSVEEEQTFTLQAQAAGANGAVSYQWTQVAGPAAQIASPQAAQTTVTAPASATSQDMQFTVTVTDQSKSITSNPVQVTVTPTPPVSITAAAASPSTLQGGGSTTLSVTVSGGKGSISYIWSQTSGVAASIAHPASAATVVSTPAVASDQPITFTVTASDSRGSTATSQVTVNLTTHVPTPVAPIHVATVVSGLASSSTTIAALTTAVVQVAFQDDNGDPLTCALTRLAGEQATISLVTSATIGNVTSFTFNVFVSQDVASQPSFFVFDAVAADPGGLQGISPQKNLQVFRRNRFVDFPGYRQHSVQVDDVTGTIHQGPGLFAIAAVTSVSATEVDLDVLLDCPDSWIATSNTVQAGWQPFVFRNPINTGAPAAYYLGTSMTLAQDYGTGKLLHATVRIRIDLGEHLLWFKLDGDDNPGNPPAQPLNEPGRNHNYDDHDPHRGFILVIDPVTGNITLPAAPSIP